MCVVVTAGFVLALHSVPLAVALICVGSGSIWLRGYILPYTPRYGPLVARRLPFFSDSQEAPVSDESDNQQQRDRAVLDTLLDRGVVRDVGEDVELDPAFHRSWTAEIERFRNHTDSELRNTVAENLRSANRAADVERVRLNDGSTYIMISGKNDTGDISLSRPATIAELGAIEALIEWLPTETETEMAMDVLLAAATPLRAFLDTCPSCGSELLLRSGGCCGPPPTDRNLVLNCVECRAVLYTY